MCWERYRGGRKCRLLDIAFHSLSSAVQELVIESVYIFFPIRHASGHHFVQEMIYSFHHFMLFICAIIDFILWKGNDEVKNKS